MAQFWDLPRELRDLIYMAILTAERPRPTLGEAQWLFKFRRIFEPSSHINGEYGCAYALEDVPPTCASFLCCNRQVQAEMNEAIEMARRKQQLAARLDCIAEDESSHYFTWLKVPLVQTTVGEPEGKTSIGLEWADRIMERYLHCPHRVLSNLCHSCRASSTTIPQLHIDIRIYGDRSGKWFRNTTPADRTSWAICAALKRIFEKGPDFSNVRERGCTIALGELVLNVVTPPNVPKEKYLDEDFPLDGVKDGLVHPKTVAKELVDVWNKIWSGDEYKGSFYQMLLQRITTVRVCVDGETYRVRELRLELERGQAERRRIAARVGW
ncbi:hypothetical protein BU24DRAFT_418945 [Aaosphaeria arxii CBS 175.79]|uniref:Uncharacterized protein n=1 Tax=Aaosphaeria arxii CBS 175.79 TaxID=1450172 RepID=A0A6A5Y268_9PLEO|nr:uncharacterized protein BU24DRAFT_418945 [Aaosphaeria arxii CBS 175.79]KAF2019339.1 hypothetical protein BU24DRAFT_418945 [Aaosphaeria arxii CBS 175.79]